MLCLRIFIHYGVLKRRNYFLVNIGSEKPKIRRPYLRICGPGSSVGIATDYRLDGPASNPGEARFSARPDRPWGPPRLLYNGYRVFPGGKERPRRAADHSPPSSAAVMEE